MVTTSFSREGLLSLYPNCCSQNFQNAGRRPYLSNSAMNLFSSNVIGEKDPYHFVKRTGSGMAHSTHQANQNIILIEVLNLQIIEPSRAVFVCKNLMCFSMTGLYFSEMPKSTESREARSAKNRLEYSIVSSRWFSRTSGFQEKERISGSLWWYPHAPKRTWCRTDCPAPISEFSHWQAPQSQYPRQSLLYHRTKRRACGFSPVNSPFSFSII